MLSEAAAAVSRKYRNETYVLFQSKRDKSKTSQIITNKNYKLSVALYYYNSNTYHIVFLVYLLNAVKSADNGTSWDRNFSRCKKVMFNINTIII